MNLYSVSRYVRSKYCRYTIGMFARSSHLTTLYKLVTMITLSRLPEEQLHHSSILDFVFILDDSSRI